MTKQNAETGNTNPKHLISGENSVTVRFTGLPPLKVHPESYLVLLAEKIQGGTQDEKT
jgi:hypothetical protein